MKPLDWKDIIIVAIVCFTAIVIVYLFTKCENRWPDDRPLIQIEKTK